MIYLASPFTSHHPYITTRKEQEQDRYSLACEAAGLIMWSGEIVFSPISHSYGPHLEVALPGDWSFWEIHDRWYLERCDSVLVLQLEGWSESVGIKAEIALAASLHKPVRFMSMDELRKLYVAKNAPESC